MTAGTPLIEIEDLSVGYGKRQTVAGLSLTVREGDIFLVLGHNGAGKTTLLRSIFGLLKPTSGRVRYRGADITGRSPKDNVRDGICFVPQGHAVFKRLTVQENLTLGAFIVEDKSILPPRVEAINELFPILRERRDQMAGTMSGGQQQMLAIGIALMLAPRLLILDEPSIGLAPNLVSAVMDSVVRVRESLGTTILMVEQNVEKSLPIATDTMIMRTGRSVYRGSPDGLSDRATLIQYL
ncbi:MAG TPA: ABC transporter ATP-binding protein [Thalassobaculum sp.]